MKLKIAAFVSVLFFSLIPGQIIAANEDTFVTVQGNKLMLGNKEFYMKGTSYFGGRYITQYVKDGSGYEHINKYQIYRNFDINAIEAEIAFLKKNLGINTIRIFTPSKHAWKDFVQYHNWEPWFMSDGTINPRYLSNIKSILSIAKKYGIRVQITLLENSIGYEIKNEGPVYSGSTRESFYFKYLNSLVSQLKNDPTIISYSIDNETLLTNDNYWSLNNPAYPQNALSFTKRMIAYIKTIDQKHLITTGEVASFSSSSQYRSLWWYPSPEYVKLPDIDGINFGVPYSLESLVDYTSPHLYSNDSIYIDLVTRAIRGKTNKPVVLGESGYMETTPGLNCLWDQVQISSPQSSNIQLTTDFVSRNGLNGQLLFEAYPQYKLINGQFNVLPLPQGVAYSKECPYYVNVTSNPQRKIRWALPATYMLFSYENLSPLLSAGIFKQAFLDKGINDSKFVSITTPDSVIVSQPFQIVVVMRNTGTKPWIKTVDQNTTYQIIDFGYSQTPNNIIFQNLGGQLPVEKVEPGEEVTIRVTGIAPSAPGLYSLSLQMVQRGKEFFGDLAAVRRFRVISN